MSKSILVGLFLLPFVGCSSGQNPKPKYAASEQPISATAPTMRYEPGAPVPVPEVVEDEVKLTAPSDVAFLDQMIPHHEEAVELAKLAQHRAEHDELKQLAATILSSQPEEIARMQSWKKQWADGADLHGIDAADDTPGAPPIGALGSGTPDPTTGAPPAGALGSDEPGHVAQDEAGIHDGAGAQGEPVAPAPEVAGAAPTDPAGPSDDLTAQEDSTATPHEAGAAAQPEGVTVSKEHEALASAEDFDKAFLDAMISHHEKGVAMARAASPRLEHAEAKALADEIISEQSEEIAKMKEWQQAWFPSDTVTAI